jgi:hypothetical protein
MTDAGTGTHRIEAQDSQGAFGLKNNATNGSQAVIYYLCYYYEYSDNGRIFSVLSPFAFREMALIGDAITEEDFLNITISDIPEIGVDVDEKNYDTANIQIRIYRTLINGSQPYLVDTISNGTTTYTDLSSDNGIQFNIPLTDLIFKNNSNVPKAKYVATSKDVCYIANIKVFEEGVEKIRENRVIQLKPGSVDELSTDFFADTDDPITGMSSYRGDLVVFTEDRSYRIEGVIDVIGRGNMLLRDLSTATGCVNNNSIIQTPRGLYFAALDGFYWSDGFRVQKLSKLLDNEYKRFISTAQKKKHIKGAYDPIEKRVYWTIADDEAGQDEPNELWMFDEDTGIKEEAAFYHWENGRHFRPTAIVYHIDKLIRGDSRGYVLEHDEDYLNDIYISPSDTLVTRPDGAIAEVGINENWTSVIFDFGRTWDKKFVHQTKLKLENISRLDMAISSGNNGTSDFVEMEPIEFKDGLIWGDEDVIWGDAEYTWKNLQYIYATRRYPRGQLRCDSKQMTIARREDKVIFQGGTCSVSGTSATILGGDTWAESIAGLNLELSTDGGLTYTVSREIISLGLATIGVDGTSIATGTYTYRITGRPKNQRLRMLSYSIKYAYKFNQGSNKEEFGGKN